MPSSIGLVSKSLKLGRIGETAPKETQRGNSQKRDEEQISKVN